MLIIIANVKRQGMVIITNYSFITQGRNFPPRGAILCFMGAILWFTRFVGRFQFPGGRILQV